MPEQLSDISINALKFAYSVKMLVNVKGAESLARALRKAIQMEIIDPYVTQDDKEIPDPKRGWVVRSTNCIGYPECAKDSFIK